MHLHLFAPFALVTRSFQKIAYGVPYPGFRGILGIITSCFSLVVLTPCYNHPTWCATRRVREGRKWQRWECTTELMMGLSVTSMSGPTSTHHALALILPCPLGPERQWECLFSCQATVSVLVAVRRLFFCLFQPLDKLLELQREWKCRWVTSDKQVLGTLNNCIVSVRTAITHKKEKGCF